MNDPFDIAVIGAGVVGCAVARELSAAHLSVVLLEARADIGDGTSKANTAILHTGFDATPGTLESRLVARGYSLLGEYAQRTGIAVERTGAVLVAWDAEQLATLPKLAEKAAKNGYQATELVSAEAVYAMVPDLGPGVLGGLTVPGESIIDPWSVTLAYVNEAIARGTELRRDTLVEGVTRDNGITTLSTNRGDLSTRWVVNAAGLGADVVDRLFGHERFTVTPRRGELIVFDKLARPMANRIILPVPSARGKGVLVSPTIFGNVMLGPTSEDLQDRSNTATSRTGIDTLLEKGRRIMPALLEEEVTAMYAGLRAATEHSDYVIDVDTDAGYALLGGIRSTGLTSSMAIAEHLHGLLSDAGLDLNPRPILPDPPQMPNLGEAYPRPHQRPDLISKDPEYGKIACFCERVSRGEIRDALDSTVPPADMDGLRRRTRAVMGRCQGFFCAAEIERLLSEGINS